MGRDLFALPVEQKPKGRDLFAPQPEQQEERQFDPMIDISAFGVTPEDFMGGINLAANLATDIPAKIIGGGAALPEILQGEGLKAAETAKEIGGNIQTELSPEGRTVAGRIGESLKGLMDNPAIASLARMGKEGMDAFTALTEITGAALSGDIMAPFKQVQGMPQTPGSTAETFTNVGGAIGQALPSTAMDAAALLAPASKLARQPMKAPTKIRGVDKMLSKASPEIELLKTKSSEAYAAVDDLGVTVKAEAFQKFADDAAKTLDKMSVDKILTPGAHRALERTLALTGDSVKVSEIQKLRELAGMAAKSITGSDKALGTVLLKKVDSFLDKLTPSQTQGGEAVKVGPLLKEARGLYSRVMKNKKVSQMIDVAENYQSGFESGLRNQATNMLKSISKGKTRGFTPDEIKALQKVSRGGGVENIMKSLSKFGIGEKQQSNALLAILGSGAGGAAFGFGGAVVLPVLGTMSGKLALKLTKGNAQYLDDITRAGKNGKKITAAYMKNTPKSQRNVAELTELLVKSDASLKNITTKNKIVNDAVWITENYSKEQALKILGLLAKKNNDAAKEEKDNR